MRDYFEEMNIDYNELKRYEDIETYYDEVQDYTKLIQELQCDRVEALKQIVNKNKEIERLNNEIKTLLKENGNKEKVIKIQDNIINKANEYIKVCKSNDMGIRYQRIEEILQGSDKE